MKHDIFISYRRGDRELVASVVRRLDARGVRAWYDSGIEGAADWDETVVEALSASQILAIFFSDECNSSRQLRKELAVADHLGKPVVPILIENTQPRGAYLYELADRNWIQAYPDPTAHINELVEHLSILANGSDASRAGAGPEAPADPEAPVFTKEDITLEEREQKLDEAIGELISDAIDPGRAAPTKAQDYVGRAGSGGKPIRKLVDIPPFRLVDLAALIPAWAAIIAWQAIAGPGGANAGIATVALYCLGFAALYGAVVFPVRYYLRRRPVFDALVKYLVSSAIFAFVGTGIILSGLDKGYLQGDAFLGQLRTAGLVWAGLSLLAFAVYGVLAGQRAIRSFRSNIRKL